MDLFEDRMELEADGIEKRPRDVRPRVTQRQAQQRHVVQREHRGRSTSALRTP